MKKFGFSKKYRIQKHDEITHLVKQGHRFRTQHLLSSSSPNTLGYLRLGISIGRKFGPAHERNRFKRLIREAFRTSSWRMPIGKDLLILAALPEKSLDYPTLSQEMDVILRHTTSL